MLSTWKQLFLVQSRNIPKGRDIQLMVGDNQHIVTALHPAVSMNE